MMRRSGGWRRTAMGGLVPALVAAVLVLGACPVAAADGPAAADYTRARRVVAAWSPLSISVAVDADGHLHVAYLEDVGRGELRYATDRGGWRSERVATVGFEAQPSIAVAPDGRVVIAFARITCPAEPGGLCDDPADDPLSRIIVASNATGTWRARARSAGPADMWPSLAIGDDGRIHIAFQRQPWPPGQARSGIWHLTDAGGWHETQVASGAGRCHADQVPSIAVGPAGAVWIAYSAARRLGTGCHGSAGIRVAAAREGRWTREVVTTDRDDGLPALALDRRARPALIFDRAGTGVRFTRRLRSGWRRPVVVSAGAEGSLTMDARGVAHVAAEGGGGIQVSVGGLGGFRRTTIHRGPVDHGTYGGPGLVLHPASGLERIVFGRSEPDTTPHEDELGVYLVRERP